MPELTDPKVFEAPLVCLDCTLPAPAGDVAVAGECTCDECNWETRTYVGQFLPFVKAADIVMSRTGPRMANGEASVSIPQRFVYHSPTGFEWGYGGSGPADLALNILALFVEPPEAWRLHQHFKSDIIAQIPEHGGTITPDEVRGWIRGHWATEKADAAEGDNIDRLEAQRGFEADSGVDTEPKP